LKICYRTPFEFLFIQLPFRSSLQLSLLPLFPSSPLSFPPLPHPPSALPDRSASAPHYRSPFSSPSSSPSAPSTTPPQLHLQHPFSCPLKLPFSFSLQLPPSASLQLPPSAPLQLPSSAPSSAPPFNFPLPLPILLPLQLIPTVPPSAPIAALPFRAPSFPPSSTLQLPIWLPFIFPLQLLSLSPSYRSPLPQFPLSAPPCHSPSAPPSSFLQLPLPLSPSAPTRKESNKREQVSKQGDKQSVKVVSCLILRSYRLRWGLEDTLSKEESGHFFRSSTFVKKNARRKCKPISAPPPLQSLLYCR
jgi:hypothetical protein